MSCASANHYFLVMHVANHTGLSYPILAQTLCVENTRVTIPSPTTTLIAVDLEAPHSLQYQIMVPSVIRHFYQVVTLLQIRCG